MQFFRFFYKYALLFPTNIPCWSWHPLKDLNCLLYKSKPIVMLRSALAHVLNANAQLGLTFYQWLLERNQILDVHRIHYTDRDEPEVYKVNFEMHRAVLIFFFYRAVLIFFLTNN